MSKFIKSSAELAAARNVPKAAPAKHRPSGFTEAELAAAEWARGLRETQVALARSTNGQQRHGVRAAGFEADKVAGLVPGREKQKENSHKKEKKKKNQQGDRGDEGKQPQDAKANGQKVWREAGAWSLRDRTEGTARKGSGDVEELDANLQPIEKREKSDRGGEEENEGGNRKKKIDEQAVGVHQKATHRNKEKKKKKKDKRHKEYTKETRETLDKGEKDDKGVYVEQMIQWEKKEKKEAKKAMRKVEKKQRKRDKHKVQDTECLNGGQAVCGFDSETEPSIDAIAQLISKAQQAISTAQEPQMLSSSESRSSSRSSTPGVSKAAVPIAPRDPKNPLEAAHDIQAYKGAVALRSSRSRRQRSSRKSQGGKSDSSSEPQWDHKPFLDRSVSPNRDRTDGPMYPTRKGEWRSRAGGVFLPPVEGTDSSDSPSASPARYIYPEEFQRRRTRSESWTSASPSPVPQRPAGALGVPRRAPPRAPPSKVGVDGGEPESPERPRRLRKRRRRCSPVYSLEAPVESSLGPASAPILGAALP